MTLLLAQISEETTSEEGRRNRRRTLKLGASASLEKHSSRAVILNLSETGMMLQTSMALKVDDGFRVELPQVGEVEARVVWSDSSQFGCEFSSPIPKSVVSAALLKSPFREDDNLSTAPVESTSPQTAAGLPHPFERALATISMLILLLIVGLFIFSLLELPFSAAQQ
jgi:hypothetical protein